MTEKEEMMNEEQCDEDESSCDDDATIIAVPTMMLRFAVLMTICKGKRRGIEDRSRESYDVRIRIERRSGENVLKPNGALRAVGL